MEWFSQNWIEVVGYIGSVVVLISLMMSNILMLRWINLIGAFTFSVYGLLINAIPVMVVNGLIVVINIYYILDIYRSKDSFSLVPLRADDTMLKIFLRFYDSDIKKYFPEFENHQLVDLKILMALRNVIPVGVFAYKKESEDSAIIAIDYIAPSYRDYKNAAYLISTRREQFWSEGIRELNASTSIINHQRYLKKIGFIQSPNKPDLFSKTLVEN